MIKYVAIYQVYAHLRADGSTLWTSPHYVQRVYKKGREIENMAAATKRAERDIPEIKKSYKNPRVSLEEVLECTAIRRFARTIKGV